MPRPCSRASHSSPSPAPAARTRTSSRTSWASRSAPAWARSVHACRCRHRAGTAFNGLRAPRRSGLLVLAWTLALHLTGATMADMLPRSDACERNKGPILEVLRAAFADCKHVLEIGSGTGQHAVHFALAMPWLVWQPSEVADAMPGLRKRIFNEGPSNLRAPVVIEVTETPWDVRKADGVFTANTLHIMHWPQVEAFSRACRPSRNPAPCSRFTVPSATAGSTASAEQRVVRRDAARARSAIRHPRFRAGGRPRARAPDSRSRPIIRCPRTTRTIVWKLAAADPG